MFGQLFRDDRDVDRAFLEHLRVESAMFSGWSLENLSGKNIPSWTDGIGAAFPSPPEGTDWSVPAFAEMTKEIPAEFLVQAPLVAGEAGWRVGTHLVNRDVIATQERTRILHAIGALKHLRSERAPVILEIGGGYGALACHLVQCVPSARYVIVDLVPSLRFSGSYLSLALGAERVAVASQKGALAPGTTTLVPAQCLEQIEDVQIDLAINTMSFSEMPAATVADYGKWVLARLTREGALFEQNHDAPEYRALETHCIPDEALGPVFPWRKKIPIRRLWGRSMLWARRKPSWFTKPDERYRA